MLFHGTTSCGGLSDEPSRWFDPTFTPREASSRSVVAVSFLRWPCTVGWPVSIGTSCAWHWNDRPTTIAEAETGSVTVPAALTVAE